LIDYLPHYPYFPDDFQRKTRHLSLVQKGAFRELLDEMWLTNQIDGTIPDDPTYCANVLGVSPTEWADLRSVLVEGPRPVLGVKHGKLFSRRLQEELDLAKRRVLAGREAGRASGQSRRGRSRTAPDDVEPESESAAQATAIVAPVEPTEPNESKPAPVTAPDWDAVARLLEITSKASMRPGPDEQMLGIWVGMFGERAVEDLFRPRGPDLKGKHYKYAQAILQRQKDNPNERDSTSAPRTNGRAASAEAGSGESDRPSRFARFDKPGWRAEDLTSGE